MNWYFKVLKKYAVFNGRARRKEYWFFQLFSAIVGLLLALIERVFGFELLSSAYALAVLIPHLAVSVRRLHDTNRSGWWYLLVLIPIIGWIVLFVFMVLDSNSEKNRFGENPKEAVVQSKT